MNAHYFTCFSFENIGRTWQNVGCETRHSISRRSNGIPVLIAINYFKAFKWPTNTDKYPFQKREKGQIARKDQHLQLTSKRFYMHQTREIFYAHNLDLATLYLL